MAEASHTDFNADYTLLDEWNSSTPTPTPRSRSALRPTPPPRPTIPPRPTPPSITPPSRPRPKTPPRPAPYPSYSPSPQPAPYPSYSPSPRPAPYPSYSSSPRPAPYPSYSSPPLPYQPQYLPRCREPDRYDGSTPWPQYKAHFLAIRDINRWSDSEAARQLAASLRGTACKVLYGERALSFNELLDRLQRRYGPGEMAENYLSILKMRIQGNQESLQELSEEIQDLSLKAYPEAEPQFLDRLAVTHFKDAILDGEVREAVNRAKPTSLDAALAAALEAENWRKLEHQRKQANIKLRQVTPTSDTSAVQELQKQVKELTGMMSTLLKKKEIKPQRKQLICWNCDQPGHKANACPRVINPNYQRPQSQVPQWSHQMGPQTNYTVVPPANTGQFPPPPPPQQQQPSSI